MNIKTCWACHTGVKFQPITNSKGEILTTHSICRNKSCPMNQQDLTAIKVKQKSSTLSKKRTKNTKRPHRINWRKRTIGITLALAACLTSYSAFAANEVTYQIPVGTAEVSKVTPPEAQNDVLPQIKPTPEQFHAYFLLEAKKAGVWVEKAEYMMQVESGGWNAHARGDQKILANGHGVCGNKKSHLYGKPANARGGAQLTECWFPNITDEQADDYKFATKFMLDTILSGKDNCRMIYSTCDAWYAK